MKIYRFRVYNKWYAYALLKDAEDARGYFLEQGYDPAIIGEIEESRDGQDFEFKMNSTTPTRAYR